jgi:DivIVA domain-containing protein
VHRVPLDQITSVTNLPNGPVKIATAGGGRRIGVWAVSTPMVAWILRRRSRANELMEAVEDAALAHGARIPPSRLRPAVGAAPLWIPMTGSAASAMSMTGHAGARFARHKWYPGYRVAEVDEFVARIEATLIGGAGPERTVTAADVRAVRFGTTRRGGYDQFVVDEALDRYAGELGRLVP